MTPPDLEERIMKAWHAKTEITDHFGNFRLGYLARDAEAVEREKELEQRIKYYMDMAEGYSRLVNSKP